MIRKNNTQYIRTVSNAVDYVDGTCMIQSFGLRLIASIRMFLPTIAGEEHRIAFLEGTDPNCYAKARGYRIYAKLEGSFRRITPEEEEANRDEIRAILADMVEEYVESISDGMRRQHLDCDKSQLREGMRPISDPRHPRHAEWLADNQATSEE